MWQWSELIKDGDSAPINCDNRSLWLFNAWLTKYKFLLLTLAAPPSTGLHSATQVQCVMREQSLGDNILFLFVPSVCQLLPYGVHRAKENAWDNLHLCIKEYNKIQSTILTVLRGVAD